MKITILITILILLSACDTPPDINRTRMAATEVAGAQTEEVVVAASNTPPPQVGEVTPAPEMTPTPFIYPALIQPTPVCPNAPRPRLILHERGRVTDDDEDDLRMRSGPGTSNSIITNLPVHTIFLVLEGPICGDQYIWWRVRYRDNVGWIAEGDEEMYYVEPYLPG